MNIQTFGSNCAPPILLIHGMLTPLSTFHTILSHLSERFYVIAPVLSGHDGDLSEHFESAEQQAGTISSFLKTHGISDLHAVIGFSLGGVIAFTFWQSWDGKIERLILDGAPLCGYSKLLTRIMTANYLSIIRRSRLRDDKTRANFEKHFLPARFWEEYLLIADTITERSVYNILQTTAVDRLQEPLRTCDTAVIYLHGTTINEFASRRSAARLKALCPQAQAICFKGEAHCYKAIFAPQDWLQVVSDFLD